jgi:hypothetical protein
MASYVKILPEHLRHPREPGETCDGFDYFDVPCACAAEMIADIKAWMCGKPGYFGILHVYDNPVYQPIGKQQFSIAITDVNTAVEFRLRWGGRREKENG